MTCIRSYTNVICINNDNVILFSVIVDSDTFFIDIHAVVNAALFILLTLCLTFQDTNHCTITLCNIVIHYLTK